MHLSFTDVYIAAIVHPLYNFGYLPVGPHFDCSIYQRVARLCCKLLLKCWITRPPHVIISVNMRGFAGKLLLLGYVSRNMRTAAANRNVFSPFHVFIVVLSEFVICWHVGMLGATYRRLLCRGLLCNMFTQWERFTHLLPLRGSYRGVLGHDIIALTADP